MSEATLAEWKSCVLRRLYDRNGRTVDLARSPTAGWVALKCRRVAAFGDARRALETLGRIQPVTHRGAFVPLLEFGFDGETNTVWEILRAVDDVGGGAVSDRSDYTPATAVERRNWRRSVMAVSSPPRTVKPPVTIITLRWPKPDTACPNRALEPGPTSSVGWGMGMKRVTMPAPFISAPRPAARVASGMKSNVKACLLWG